MSEISVLDKGFVRLDAAMADDLSVVNAARVSFAKRSALDVRYETVGDECYCEDSTEACDCFDLVKVESLNDFDSGLIRYLLTHKHGTPFEHNAFRFHVKCPIFVAREWMRHRIGSFNEVSTRYVEMEPDFYVPKEEAIRRQIGKPGHYVMEPFPQDEAHGIDACFQQAYRDAYAMYQNMLSWGVAKELARNVLPLGLMTQFIWTVNLRSLLNFLSLRTHPTALLEIRQEAEEVERLARTVVPVAMTAWGEHGRLSP